jgi:DNA-binding GntR family transcriptional regulator
MVRQTLSRSLHQHMNIIAAIEARDADLAEKLVRHQASRLSPMPNSPATRHLASCIGPNLD